MSLIDIDQGKIQLPQFEDAVLGTEPQSSFQDHHQLQRIIPVETEMTGEESVCFNLYPAFRIFEECINAPVQIGSL